MEIKLSFDGIILKTLENIDVEKLEKDLLKKNDVGDTCVIKVKNVYGNKAGYLTTNKLKPGMYILPRTSPHFSKVQKTLQAVRRMRSDCQVLIDAVSAEGRMRRLTNGDLGIMYPKLALLAPCLKKIRVIHKEGMKEGNNEKIKRLSGIYGLMM